MPKKNKKKNKRKLDDIDNYEEQYTEDFDNNTKYPFSEETLENIENRNTSIFPGDSSEIIELDLEQLPRGEYQWNSSSLIHTFSEQSFTDNKLTLISDSKIDYDFTPALFSESCPHNNGVDLRTLMISNIEDSTTGFPEELNHFLGSADSEYTTLVPLAFKDLPEGKGSWHPAALLKKNSDPLLIPNANLHSRALKGAALSHMLFAEVTAQRTFLVEERGRTHVYEPSSGSYEALDTEQLHVCIRGALCPKSDLMITGSLLNEITRLIRTSADLRISKDDFRPPKHLINLKNGVFNLSTGEIEDHSVKHRFRFALNVEYAKDPKYGCKYISLIQGLCGNDPEALLTIQEYSGYLLYNGNPAKKFMIIKGPPSCGKSVLLEIKREIIGPEHVANIQLHDLGTPFATGHLSRMHVNICSEIDSRPLKNLVALNQLTSQEGISAQDKGKDHFSYTSNLKLMYAGNLLPYIPSEEIAEAFYDRVLIIQAPASVKDEDRNPDLKEEILSEEREFVLNWALNGLMRLISNNFRFTTSLASKELTKSLRKAPNSAKEFIRDHMKVTGNDEDRLHSGTIYPIYQTFCKSNCLDILSSNAFFKELEKTSCKKAKFRLPGQKEVVSALWGFKGLRLTYPPD